MDIPLNSHEEEFVSTVEANLPFKELTPETLCEWQCPQGHSWVTTYSKKLRGNKCPQCVNLQRALRRQQPEPGKDLASLYPAVAQEWHPEKNVSLREPKEYRPKSHTKAWWLCDKRHEWEASIEKRTRGDKCPVCSNKKILAGFNDLATVNPELADQWHPTKNLPATPTLIGAGSEKKVWWKCVAGHEWQSTVESRHRNHLGCPFCSGQRSIRKVSDLETTYPHLLTEWDYEKNIHLAPTEAMKGSDKKVWWKCAQGHSWEAVIYSRTSKNPSGCPRCALIVSKAEEELYQFVTELLPNTIVLLNTRKIITPFELDIYIPSKNLAIEYNGLYWHSEAAGKDKWYHHKKWKACKDQGIQLIQIWEDDWNRNPDLVKRMLTHKLGLSQRKVYARKTTPVSLTQEELSMFLEENHIQGAVAASVRYGLKVDDELVAAIAFKKEGATLNLLRFASSIPVAGGFSKLLQVVESLFSDVERIVTFSDNTVSDGGLYETSGFVAEQQLPPDYSYLVKGNREHKFNYRVARFRKDSSLKWEPGFSERDLAILNGIPRIWDAGKVRWVKQEGLT